MISNNNNAKNDQKDLKEFVHFDQDSRPRPNEGQGSERDQHADRMLTHSEQRQPEGGHPQRREPHYQDRFQRERQASVKHGLQKW